MISKKHLHIQPMDPSSKRHSFGIWHLGVRQTNQFELGQIHCLFWQKSDHEVTTQVLSLKCLLAWSAFMFCTPGMCDADNQMALSMAQAQMLFAGSFKFSCLLPILLIYATVVVLSMSNCTFS